MKAFRGILLQISVICSLVCIITKVLDWFNPYMDFTGHVWYIQLGLYTSVITMMLLSGVHKKFTKN